MAPRPSDTRRRELGAELRRRRELAGLNGLELARKVGWSASVISRLESGSTGVSEVTVTTYLAHCGVPAPEVAGILRLARETEDGYLVRRDVLRTLVLHETTATAIQEAAPRVVPGLLQTEDYMRAIMRRLGVQPESEIDSRTATRLDRQSILTGRRSPQCTFFIYESVLRCPMGGDRVMNEQLLHLAFLADRPHIAIHIVPFTVGELVAIAGDMRLMDFAEHGPVLYLENRYAGLFVDHTEDTRYARSLLRQLTADALDAGQSRELLARMASEYDRPPEGAP